MSLPFVLDGLKQSVIDKLRRRNYEPYQRDFIVDFRRHKAEWYADHVYHGVSTDIAFMQFVELAMDRAWKDTYKPEMEYERERPRLEQAADKKKLLRIGIEESKKVALSEKSVLNPITGRWDPDKLSVRQVEWLMERKRRLLKEGKIKKYIFEFEMKELAKLKRKIVAEKKIY